MSAVQGVLFDKDGTLFDFRATWQAWCAGFLRRIAHQDEARAQSLGAAIGFDLARMRFDKGSVVIAGTPDDILQVLAPYLPEHSAEALFSIVNEEAANAPQMEVTPLAPFLEGLRARGLKLGVATNDAEAPALAHLNKAGVAGHFDFIAGFDSGYGAKPSAGQLLGFAAHVGLAPDRIVMVGDSTHDLIAGRAAGMRTVAVLTGMAETQDLAHLAETVLPDIVALPAWIAAQG